MADHSMLGTDFDAILECWSTMGLNYYVITKLNWDPYQDVDNIIDDYCKSGFGKGRKWIRRYWDRIESITNDGAVHKDRHMLAPYTPEIISELSGYLDNAEKEAGTDNKISARISFLRSGLSFTAIQADAFHLNNKIKNNPQDKKLAVAGQKMLDKKWLFMRNLYYQYPLSVDVALARFYSERCFTSLGNRKPSKDIVKKSNTGQYKTKAANIKILEADEKGRLVIP
jgi:hypothetical protein